MVLEVLVTDPAGAKLFHFSFSTEFKSLTFLSELKQTPRLSGSQTGSHGIGQKHSQTQ